MPLSSRMMNKGYSSKDLTEDKLMTMDFSYGGRESPQGDQGETTAKKLLIGSRVINRDDKCRVNNREDKSRMSNRENKSQISNRDDKSRSSNRSTPRFNAPVFKKHHTVA